MSRLSFLLVTVLYLDLINATKILVLGGSGRVGGSSVRAFCKAATVGGTDCSVAVAGRSEGNWKTYQQIYSQDLADANVDFIPLDIYDTEGIREIFPHFDLIVHTAGPFQGLKQHTVLKTALELGKTYIDVCDDISLSRIARSEEYQRIAQRTGGKAVISTGIWPGCSSILAEELLAETPDAESVDFLFFTAGSGGAGPTILTATFLLLGEEALCYEQSRQIYRKPGSILRRNVDFGPGIGPRDLALLGLIEAESCFASAKGRVKNTATYFGTAPPVWNTLFQLMTAVIPGPVLRNRDLMGAFGSLSLPMVRAVDNLVGGANGIRVNLLNNKKEVIRTAILSHASLEDCVGEAIALFGLEMAGMLPAHTQEAKALPPGVYFPEEIPSRAIRQRILEGISKSAMYYNTNHVDQAETVVVS